MAILWAVEMESEDYKTGLHCGGRAKTERGKKKQREKASKTIESAEGWRMGRMRIMLMKLPPFSLPFCTPVRSEFRTGSDPPCPCLRRTDGPYRKLEMPAQRREKERRRGIVFQVSPC